MAKPCAPVDKCPIIKPYCTPTQQKNSKCYIRVGKVKYKTRTQGKTADKVAKLIIAQAKKRCRPVVQARTADLGPSKRSLANKARKASLMQLKKDMKDRRKVIQAEYKASLAGYRR